MVSLYNCKHDGDQYRITKFTDGLEVESSYLVDPTACECPAFTKRGRCKHQEMLPFFVNRRAVGSGEMFDWERGGWVRMFPDEPEPVAVAATVERDAQPSPEIEPTVTQASAVAAPRAHGSVVTTAGFDSANGGSSPPAPAPRFRRR